MTGHTPGPWQPDFSSEAIRVRAPDGSGVCTINWLSARGRRDGNEGEANAHLIAAAPEMLAALEKIDQRVHAVGDLSGDLAQVTQALAACHQLARAAIAKAHAR